MVILTFVSAVHVRYNIALMLHTPRPKCCIEIDRQMNSHTG